LEILFRVLAPGIQLVFGIALVDTGVVSLMVLQERTELFVVLIVVTSG
jgi:hypothetical protein